MNLSIIVAVDNSMLIGKDNRLPWNIKGDLIYFKKSNNRAYDYYGKKDL